MLEYDRIDISEEGMMLIKQRHQKNVIFVTIDILKIDIGFKYEPYLCNDLMQKAMSFNDVAIIYVKESAYRIHFWYMSKDDAISIMNNSNLIDKKGVSYFFINVYKMGVCDSSEETYLCHLDKLTEIKA